MTRISTTIHHEIEYEMSGKFCTLRAAAVRSCICSSLPGVVDGNLQIPSLIRRNVAPFHHHQAAAADSEIDDDMIGCQSRR
mmetsp:Transcript_2512/g.4571  ORF Transcript_2512/g.4571 Transcript_2512/m.4571 type:complete len:81 (-) Transcript_2512:95-337(-)